MIFQIMKELLDDLKEINNIFKPSQLSNSRNETERGRDAKQ